MSTWRTAFTATDLAPAKDIYSSTPRSAISAKQGREETRSFETSAIAFWDEQSIEREGSKSLSEASPYIPRDATGLTRALTAFDALAINVLFYAFGCIFTCLRR